MQFRSLNSSFSVYTELPLECYHDVLLIEVVTPGVKLIHGNSKYSTAAPRQSASHLICCLSSIHSIITWFIEPSDRDKSHINTFNRKSSLLRFRFPSFWKVSCPCEDKEWKKMLYHMIAGQIFLTVDIGCRTTLCNENVGTKPNQQYYILKHLNIIIVWIRPC